MSRYGQPHGDKGRKPSPFDKTRRKLGWTYVRLAAEAGLTLKQCWDVLHGEAMLPGRIDAIKAALKRGADSDRRFALEIKGVKFEDVDWARV